MGEAGLVRGPVEALVGFEAVVDQDSRVILGDDPAAGLQATLAGDQVRHRLLAHERVEPGQPAADAPAGLVGDDPRRRRDVADDGMVVRQAPSRRPQHGLAGAAAGDRDAEERSEERADLALRQPGVFIQVDDRRLGERAELAGAAAQGVGGLQRMAPLHPPAAPVAVADVDVELSIDGPAWDLGLILLTRRVVRKVSAATAMVGQRGLMHLVDDRRDGAEGLGAVVVAGLSAGRFRVGFRRALGERRRLAFAGAGRGRQFGFEHRQPCFEAGNAPVTLGAAAALVCIRVTLRRIRAE